jgi:hypothetical protein
MELRGGAQQRVWATEDTEQDLGFIYRRMGVEGREGIENVGLRGAQVVEVLIWQWA